MIKIAFNTLGCKVNQYETEAMKARFKDAGYLLVGFKEIADIYIINTCTVTNMADKKSRQVLAKAKKLNPKSMVVAVGCYVQTDEAVLKDMPYIDLLVGNTDKKNLVKIVESYIRDKEVPIVKSMAKYKHYDDDWVGGLAGDIRAYIKVQDGCNQFCTYCIIPFTRGRIRSREKTSILEEVRSIVKIGRREVVITGIHLASYGEEFENYSLIELLEDINKIDGLYRIRLGSLEPGIITDEFIDRIMKLEKFCPHFHLSLQSGSNDILKRMNRRYTVSEFIEATKILRAVYKSCSITTDLIVGFPGETIELFEETCSMIEEVKFFDIHVFKYSKRNGTKAALMKGQIAGDEKRRRSKILISIVEKYKKLILTSYINTYMEVLVEEKVIIEGIEYLLGHTMNYMKVYISIKNHSIEDEIVTAKIVRLFKDGLLGE